MSDVSGHPAPGHPQRRRTFPALLRWRPAVGRVVAETRARGPMHVAWSAHQDRPRSHGDESEGVREVDGTAESVQVLGYVQARRRCFRTPTMLPNPGARYLIDTTVHRIAPKAAVVRSSTLACPWPGAGVQLSQARQSFGRRLREGAMCRSSWQIDGESPKPRHTGHVHAHLA